jgi:signal transduction histidine kinase
MHKVRHLSIVRKDDLQVPAIREGQRQILRHLDDTDEDENRANTKRDTGQRDMARKAFLGLLNHELRTPLNSVIGFSEVLTYELYGPLGAPQYVEYAHLIRDSGLQILTLVKNALEIVRLESGYAEIEMKTHAVAPLLADLVGRYADEARERHIRLETHIVQESLEVFCDDYALQSSLDQLMLNALEFCPAGGTIVIEAAQAGEKTMISLFNPGKAPAPREVERLMRPFEKGDQSSQALKGSGLGWSIVRLSMKAMEGRFEVDSDPKKGLKAILSLKSSG